MTTDIADAHYKLTYVLKGDASVFTKNYLGQIRVENTMCLLDNVEIGSIKMPLVFV